MRITLVKKILADGSPCAKCADVETRLTASGQMSRIDRVVVADERDPNSEGMRLAARHGVATAPFFVVEQPPVDADSPDQPPRQETTVYTVYLRFIRDIFGKEANTAAEARETVRANPDLGLL